MMKIKSARSFRKSIWADPHGGNSEASVDYDFIGSFTGEGKETRHGFFKLFHGIKPDIPAFLPSLLKIAEDAQAIYEFLQNAVDCGSTHFYIYYNDDYFLAINNGTPFDREGLISMLNIAQTTKKSCDMIGRFGVGFKLIHRLVGKSEGIDELVREYKGPLMFSWSERNQFKALVEGDPIEQVEEHSEEYENAPYLLKLIITNFPAAPCEQVRDLDYSPRIMFEQRELEELKDFVSSNINSEDLTHPDRLNQGTLFFLKLGEGKKNILDRDYENLKKGVQYSMNMLKKLQKVYINSEEINREHLLLEEFEIAKASEAFDRINPEYKECNIRISIGYPELQFGDIQSYIRVQELKSSPNFYKYFPMGDETNGLAMIIHSDSFSNEVNRRKLQKDETNKNLFPEISGHIIERLEYYLKSERTRYLQLYVVLLLSDVPNKQNNEWLSPIFYHPVLEYLRINIPTRNMRTVREAEMVKINKLKINIEPSEFGLKDIEWFEWNNVKDQLLLIEASNKDKLGLESWDIRDLVEKGELESINTWIAQQDEERYARFLTELESSDLRIATKNRLLEIKLFKFSNDSYYSVSELEYYPNLIFNIDKTFAIADIINELGIVSSIQNISVFPNIYSAIKLLLPSDLELYELIATHVQENQLEPSGKRLLFLNLCGSETKFDNIGKATLKKLKLFANQYGDLVELGNLVSDISKVPVWMNLYKIRSDEYFSELEEYLISENFFYSVIILPQWEEILERVSSPGEFYEKVSYYYHLDDGNAQLKDEAYIYVNEQDGFQSPEMVLYHPGFERSSNYGVLREAIHTLTGIYTPARLSLPFLSKAPFKTDVSNLLKHISAEDTELELEEIKSVLSFCKDNNEHFFEKFHILKLDKCYRISVKTTDTYQVRSSGRESKALITSVLCDTLFILPPELEEFKDEPGIISGEGLYKLILELIDIDDYQEELLDIIKHDVPKRLLLKGISSITFTSGRKYLIDDYEVRLLNMILQVVSEEDEENVREKFKILVNDTTLSLKDIPPLADQITILEKTLSLAKILPETRENSNYLNDLIKMLTSLGYSEVRLNRLFGVIKEPESSEIYKMLKDQYQVLKNGHQIAFLMLYGKFETVDFSDFNVVTLDGEFSLASNYYLSSASYINANAVLGAEYHDIKEILSLPYSFGEDNGLSIMEGIYFDKEGLYAPCLKSSMKSSEQIELIGVLFQFFMNRPKEFASQQNWKEISGTEIKEVLGFNPEESVYPTEWAMEEEQLPEYISDWMAGQADRIKFFTILGVWTPGSSIVDLRTALASSGIFQNPRLAQDNKIAGEKLIFNTFLWITEKIIILNTPHAYETLIEMVRVINTLREEDEYELIIEEEFDFKLLNETTIEWEAPHYQKWVSELHNLFNIYLNPGLLPKRISLDEINDYVFYRFNSGDICIDNTNKIFINQDADIEKALNSLIALDKGFTYKYLYMLYQSEGNRQDNQDKIPKLEREVERLRDMISGLNQTSSTDATNATVQIDEYFDEIKEESESYLYNVLKNLYPGLEVRWLNFKEQLYRESWQNHDFEILDNLGKVLHYIDCKGTPMDKCTFYLTAHEWKFFLSCTEKNESYQIYRVFNTASVPEYVCIDDLWAWIREGKVVPYLSATETIKGGRVFLTLV